MPTLEKDRLVFRFPEIEEKASFSIDFQRTLRIPDSEKTYPLPPGLGRFPLRHVEDLAANLPIETTYRGGIILPMWQAEAMWLRFSNKGPHRRLPFPVAIKVAAGKINAVTGEPWRPGLHRSPQDYMVSPGQPWLDGFAIEPGVIRQFVAMPLGEGYTAEWQLTGVEEWGGLQISVVPLKARLWKAIRELHEQALPESAKRSYYPAEEPVQFCLPSVSTLGLAAGGCMKQEIYKDRFTSADWDESGVDRVFVSLIHAKDWKSITGEAASNPPPSAKAYARAGLPWFDYYGSDRQRLPGSAALAGLKSLGAVFLAKTGATLPRSGDADTAKPTRLGPGAACRAIDQPPR
jgi:hypothetical protein